MPGSPAVRVEGFSKSFRLPREQTHTLKERVLHPLRRTSHERFDALKPIAFDVEQGEFFGIVGRNGSGKSTLLKCLAGIYRADTGRAWVRGRLSTFIELGVGFNMDLPARENIRLNGVMLGLSARQARARESEVIAFAGLEGFEDLKIKNFSSGMLVRLGFSIMVHVDADVLLIDEVLAVGDAEFQQRCFEQFDRIRQEGRTVLFVTHDMAAVQRYCDRALVLHHGEVRMIGRPDRVAQEYLRLNMEARETGPDRPGPVDAALRRDDPDRSGDGAAEITDAWFEDGDGAATPALAHGQPGWFVFVVRFHRDVEHPVFGVTIGASRHGSIISTSTGIHNQWTGRFLEGQEVSVRMHFECVLEAGKYAVTPSVAHHGIADAFMDRRDDFVAVVVTNPQPTPGLVVPPHSFEIRSREREPQDARS